MRWGFSEPSFLTDYTVLLGLKREVTAFTADCIMPGWIFGSSNSFFTVTIPEPSVGSCQHGVPLWGWWGGHGGMFASMAVLLEGQPPWAGTVCVYFVPCLY